ncbi:MULTISPECIES: M16 family metallopeptidase [Calditerrivibrio]|jgi:predicted Zn-dependent peptidase|uniref:M16 family metallopeptidase n=1 Tax=Calditerrivibrio TaxID=545865 RepID=UPI003C709A36
MRALLVFFIFFSIFSNIYAGEHRMLKNGVTLITEKRDYTNTVAVTIFIKGGVFREDHNNNGIGELFNSVWLKSNSILEKIEFYGGLINSSVSYDYGEVNLSIISEFSTNIMDELEKFILNPDFDKKIFDIEKNIQINRIKSIRDNANSVAGDGFNKATYGDFAYGMSLLGTLESVSKLTKEDLIRYYQDMMNSDDVILSVAGNYSDQFLNRLIDIFERIPKKESKYKISCEGAHISKDIFVEEEYDRIKQAKLFLSYTAPSASSKDYLAIKLLADILGGGMSSKYFNILRKEKGYAYSVGSYYASRLCSSRFVAYIGLQYENAPDAIDIMDKINKNIKYYVTEDDLTSNKNYILGKILSEAQTNGKVAWYNAFFYNLGLGSDYFSKYIDGIKNVSLKDIMESARIFNGPKAIYILKPTSK